MIVSLEAVQWPLLVAPPSSVCSSQLSSKQWNSPDWGRSQKIYWQQLLGCQFLTPPSIHKAGLQLHLKVIFQRHQSDGIGGQLGALPVAGWRGLGWAGGGGRQVLGSWSPNWVITEKYSALPGTGSPSASSPLPLWAATPSLSSSLDTSLQRDSFFSGRSTASSQEHEVSNLYFKLKLWGIWLLILYTLP